MKFINFVFKKKKEGKENILLLIFSFDNEKRKYFLINNI
jgi:hypothetical protein